MHCTSESALHAITEQCVVQNLWSPAKLEVDDALGRFESIQSFLSLVFNYNNNQLHLYILIKIASVYQEGTQSIVPKISLQEPLQSS